MKGKKVLIVEDNNHILLLQTHILKGQGFEIHSATNGAEAMAGLYANLDNAPDLIILDLMMPVMDGIEFLKSSNDLRQKNNIPVLVVSSLNEKSKIVDALKLGADDYLIKPIDKDILIDKAMELTSNENIPFAEIKVDFELRFENDDRGFKACGLSENYVNILSEEILNLEGNSIIVDCFLTHLIGESEGILIKTHRPIRLDGQYITKCQFVGMCESKRSKIRSVTVRGEDLSEFE